jgi:hypothetical protein
MSLVEMYLLPMDGWMDMIDDDQLWVDGGGVVRACVKVKKCKSGGERCFWFWLFIRPRGDGVLIINYHI